jgi:hypothetical protein
MKKQIEARIRGRLPKETTLPKTSTQTYFSPTQMHNLKVKPTPTQLGPGTLRATKLLGGLFILWTFSSFLFITQVYRNYPIPISSLIVSIAIGLILGFATTAIFTQNQIRYFERNSRFPTPNPGPLFVTAIVAVVFIVIVGYVGVFAFPAIAGEIFISVFSLTPTFYAARCILFSRYEKKKDIYIIQYWLQSGTFALPKRAPADDTQAVQEMVGKQENSGMS